MSVFKHLDNPVAEDIGNNIEEFLQIMGQPTYITIDGADSTRTRALVTLLHGNEPSGLSAVFRWIKSGRKPAMNIVCVIASVEASLMEPIFSYRVIPGFRDLNRCFKSPYTIDSQGLLAEEILNLLNDYQPESVVDMHNTSGSGPSFGVVTHMDERHDALSSLFTQRIIVTDLRLGALMEISEHLFPTVTVECGGRLDDDAHQVAWEGLQRYFTEDNVLSPQETDWGLEMLHNPVRLELQNDCELTYAEHAVDGYCLTLRQDVEHHNFGVIEKDTMLGWTHRQVDELFSSRNAQDQCVLNELVYVDDGKLFTRKDLKFFMITTNPVIAKMDCLFYAVLADGQEIVV